MSILFILVTLVPSVLLQRTAAVVSTPQTNTDILPKDYSRDIAPTIDGHPVEVNVSLVILSLKPELNAQMSFSVDFFYQLYWIDDRLIVRDNQTVTLGPQWKDRLWMPDTYFRNSIQGGVAKLFADNVYFRVTDKRSVFMAARVQMKLNCDMNFFKFPFDRQTCFINITTLSQTLENVRLNWELFRVGNHVVLPEFEMIKGVNDECTKSFGKIGRYSCLFATIHLRRIYGKYLIKRFIPSTLIVIMTFIGFWIPTQVTPARVSLIITALLALIAQQIQGELNISYIYALEVYTIICILFVFATLIEYAIAISWPKRPNNLQQNSVETNNRHTKRWVTLVVADERNCSVDAVSRVLFPSAFAISIVIYSLCYYYA